jgi:hypothetical protein
MARPRKQASERRSTSVRADLTLAEKAYVQTQAANAGISEAEYTRRRVLDYSVAPELETRTKAAFVSEVNRLGNQVAAIGNLVNQVALYCHTDRRIPPQWDCLPNEIKDLKQSIEETLERILTDGP